MTLIDPVTFASADPRAAAAPPYVDEDPNVALVQQGLDVAEDETREAVADGYEKIARLSDDPLESLDDIDREEGEGISIAPELAAIHEEFLPSQNDIPKSGEEEE